MMETSRNTDVGRQDVFDEEKTLEHFLLPPSSSSSSTPPAPSPQPLVPVRTLAIADFGIVNTIRLDDIEEGLLTATRVFEEFQFRIGTRDISHNHLKTVVE